MNKENYDHPLSSIFTDRFFRFLVLILLFIALLLSQKNLILISILILTIVYICKLWSHFSIKNIYYSYDAETKKGFPGETILLQVKIYNNKILPIWLKLLIPIEKGLILKIDRENDYLGVEFYLLWYDNFFWNFNFTAKQRGCYQVGPPFMETSDILGFFQQRKCLSHSTVEVLIYPRPISLNFLPTPTKELFGKTGNNNPIKDPIYPIAARDYQYGEPAKFIHWKASARYNKLQSKIFDPSTQRKTLLLIEVSFFQKKRQVKLFEKTLEVVAAILLEFDRQGSSYGILSNGKSAGSNIPAILSFGTGPEQLSAAMEFLARLTMAESCSLDDILFKDIYLPAGTGCLYCDYSINEKNIQICQLLKKHNVPVYCIIAKASYKRKIDCIPSFLLSEIYGEVLDFNQTERSNINHNL